MDSVTLGLQTSGEDDRTALHVLLLRKLLAEHCKGPYSSEVREYALILRVGGDMQEFAFRGCQRIRRNRKQAYITADLGFPSCEWKGRSDQHIKQYLVDTVCVGLKCCLDRLKKDGVAVDEGTLLADYEQVTRLYLN